MTLLQTERVQINVEFDPLIVGVGTAVDCTSGFDVAFLFLCFQIYILFEGRPSWDE